MLIPQFVVKLDTLNVTVVFAWTPLAQPFGLEHVLLHFAETQHGCAANTTWMFYVEKIVNRIFQ